MKLPVAALSVMLCSCAANCPPPKTTTPVDETAAVMQADRDFAKATSDKGVEGWVSFFAPDGAQMPDGRDLVVGHDAIRAFMTPVFAKIKLQWAPERGEASGNVGYTMGRARIFRVEDGKEIRRSKYLTVWHKQPDGSWRVALDVGTDDPVPQ